MSYSFPISKMCSKRFPLVKTMVMVSFYIQQAFQLYKIYNIWSWYDTPTNYFNNCYIIGIILPLNKTTFATSIKYKTSTVLSLEI